MALSTDKDKWECVSDPSRCFTVKGLRNYITNSSIPLEFTPTRWNKLVPLKVNIASWRIKRLRIPTRVNLDRRGIDLHSLRCPVCDEDLETEEHLLVNCFVAKATLSEVLKWWKVSYIQINNLNDILTLANQTNFTATNVMLFDAVVQSTLWILWRFRNESTFNLKRPKQSLILNDIKLFTHTWISHRCRKASINWIEWYCNPCNALPVAPC
ncbi:RNA-directed DNA polymerase, eukaryota, reverse transcriptase zinc-binding domain protein [Tanacetum coccineum]